MTINNIKFGDYTNFNGDFIVANTIQNSFNKLSGSQASDEIKDKLKELNKAVVEMCKELPSDKAREAARNVEALTGEAVSEKPRQEWYELAAKGLKNMATTVGRVGGPVISIIESLLPLLAHV